MTTQPIIDMASIRKPYGRTIAVDDVSFRVEAGEIFGLIGPTGAGCGRARRDARGVHGALRARLPLGVTEARRGRNMKRSREPHHARAHRQPAA
jgi:ABC-2 type transport system ATP-binding protein